MKILDFFLFLWDIFAPSGSGSAISMRIRIQQFKLMRIRIRNPDFFHPGSASNTLSILTQKLVCKLWEISHMTRLVHPGTGSGFFTHSRSGSCFFAHPGSRGQKGTGSQIRIRNIDLVSHFPSPKFLI